MQTKAVRHIIGYSVAALGGIVIALSAFPDWVPFLPWWARMLLFFAVTLVAGRLLS